MGKTIAKRLLYAFEDPSLFPGVNQNELPFLRMCGNTIIAILCDIIVDMYQPELAAQI